MSMYRVLRRVSRHLSAASRHLLATNRSVTTTGSCSGNESVSNYEQFRNLAVTEPATAVMQVRKAEGANVYRLLLLSQYR